MTEHTVHIPATISNDTLHSIVDDLGFDWYWAGSVRWYNGGTNPDSECLEIGWIDGRAHHIALTFAALASGVAALASGVFTNDSYQIKAAVDYLQYPEEADGDYWTTDFVVQLAAFGELVFG